MYDAYLSGEALYQKMIVITNRHLVEGDYLEQIKKVLSLHPYALILREKDLSDEEYRSLAEKVMPLCDRAEVPCFLNTKLSLAKSLGTRNIQMASAAFQAADHTQLAKDFDRISVSCHSVLEAMYASTHEASQIILGTIFETDCKKGLKGRGLGFVKEVTDLVKIPVFAIGGVTEEKMPGLVRTGAAGGCMMSGFMRF